MSSHSRLPDDYSKRANSTCHSADFTGSSWRQPSSNSTNKKVPSSKCQGPSRFSDKSEESCPFAKPYIDRHIEPRGQGDDENVIKLTSGSFPKSQVCSKVNTETDIVRHMKNLPSYLHPVEKPKNVQDRALNVGVLDWKRLEKWRDKETLPKKGESRASSRVNSMSRASETPAPSRTSRHKKHGSVDLHANPLLEETLFNYATQHSQEKVQNLRDSQNSGIGTVFGKHTEFPQKMKLSFASLEVKNDEGKKIDRNQKMTLQKECLPQSSVKSSFRIPSVPISELQGEKSRGNDSIKLGPGHSADEPQDIVLLVPNASRRSSSKSHHLVESKRSHDGKSVEKDQKSHSCRYSSQELQPGKYTEGLGSDVCTSDFRNDTRRSSGKKHFSVDYSFAAETSEKMDFGTAEKSEVESRPQSPSRRFSFNLGKIGRSFSFRESSTVSKDNSKSMDAKSGPISSESLSGIVDHNREKAHTSSLGWSSSFRKILNPVLKPKAAHSDQTSHSNLVVPEPTSAIKLRRASNFQAVVQLTFKNELPCFRFVAGNSSEILTASIKDLPTKTDTKFSYSFYSVTEVKKKSTSWIGHGSKEKLCGFDHKALCQMKISATCSPSMAIEYVLYGVRVGEVDKGGDLEVLLNREIAAIVVKEPSAVAYGSESDEWCKHIESDLLAPVVDTTKVGETEDINNTLTVILPCAIHGLPNEGAPSSLIERWKSGGVCDCGGWDMGCKMRVLIDDQRKEETDYLSASTNICSLIDSVDISKQEDGKGKKQATLCVAPFKDGYYSVNFDSSISELEAFGICVAVLTSQRLSDILDVNNLFVEERNQSANEKKGDNPPNTFPAKYFSSPPTSPAGRI